MLVTFTSQIFGAPSPGVGGAKGFSTSPGSCEEKRDDFSRPMLNLLHFAGQAFSVLHYSSEYVLAPYLSAVKGFKSRKVISRFRCGCHGLHVDTGRLLPLAQQVPREQRHCVFCASGSAEDEHHFVFDCLVYWHNMTSGTSSQTSLGAQLPRCLPFSLCMIPKS